MTLKSWVFLLWEIRLMIFNFYGYGENGQGISVIWPNRRTIEGYVAVKDQAEKKVGGWFIFEYVF